MIASSGIGRVCILTILLAITIAHPVRSQSNEGREFWLGFMEHRDLGANDMVIMITSRVNTTGTVSIPERGFSESFSVIANDVTVVELPDYVETEGSEYVNNNAIRVTANANVSVYMHQYFGMRSEASVVLPNVSLGSDYYVISFTGVPDGLLGPGPYPSEFLIVAIEDETTIEYTLAANTQEGAARGTTEIITLNAGEVYQVRASDYLNDLTGTSVNGDKDFALFAGTSWSQVPIGCFAMDNLLEQMYPVSTWGTKYVAAPFANTTVDLYRVIASEDNTLVSIQGSTSDNLMLDAGRYLDFQASDGVFIESNRPISVAQYIMGSDCNGDVGDPSMVILNTVEQIRDTVTLFNSRFFNITEQYLNVTTRTGEEDLVFLDGRQVTALGLNFTPIGDNGDFSYATIPTIPGAHTLFTQGCGIIAMAYGYGDIESYAYSGGASFTDINANQIPPGGCLNDTIFFESGLPPERFNVLWDLGNGMTTEEHDFEHLYDALGSYPVSLVIEDLCFGDIDTNYRDLMVTLRQDLTAIDHVAGCEETDIQLEAFDLDGASFEWTGPEDFEAEEQFPTIAGISLDQEGIYDVVGNISGCKTFPVSVFVEVYENPFVDLGQDLVLCPLDGETATLDAGSFPEYEWQDGSTFRDILVDEEGEYSVEVTDDLGCMNSDTVFVMQQCPTRFYIPNVFSPNRDGVNDFFGVSGIEILSMNLKVYSLWGELIFESINEDQRWDGTFRNQNAAIGEYTWIFEFEGYDENAAIYRDRSIGTVLLVR